MKEFWFRIYRWEISTNMFDLMIFRWRLKTRFMRRWSYEFDFMDLLVVGWNRLLRRMNLFVILVEGFECPGFGDEGSEKCSWVYEFLGLFCGWEILHDFDVFEWRLRMRILKRWNFGFDFLNLMVVCWRNLLRKMNLFEILVKILDLFRFVDGDLERGV